MMMFDTADYFDLDSCESDVTKVFIRDIAPYVYKQYGEDQIAMDEEFNNWTDSLCKSGDLCDYAYENVCLRDLDSQDWTNIARLATEI